MYQRIRALREDKDMTQTQMGRILLCSQRVYSNYERGDIDIPTAILIRLADFHQVSVDYLLNRTDNPHMPRRFMQLSAVQTASCTAPPTENCRQNKEKRGLRAAIEFSSP